MNQPTPEANWTAANQSVVIAHTRRIRALLEEQLSQVQARGGPPEDQGHFEPVGISTEEALVAITEAERAVPGQSAIEELSEVFGLSLFGTDVPLLLIAIMTFVLITSSGTMALAVNMGYRKNRKATFWLMVVTAVLGATFVGMQAFEWTKLIMEGVRPWQNPFGAAQFGSSFFMITGFHGMHVTAGVIYLLVVANRVRNGFYEKRGGNYEIVEITGLYWHFVDLVWVFIFAFFYLW